MPDQSSPVLLSGQPGAPEDQLRPARKAGRGCQGRLHPGEDAPAPTAGCSPGCQQVQQGRGTRRCRPPGSSGRRMAVSGRRGSATTASCATATGSGSCSSSSSSAAQCAAGCSSCPYNRSGCRPSPTTPDGPSPTSGASTSGRSEWTSTAAAAAAPASGRAAGRRRWPACTAATAAARPV